MTPRGVSFLLTLLLLLLLVPLIFVFLLVTNLADVLRLVTGDQESASIDSRIGNIICDTDFDRNTRDGFV